MTGKSDDVKLTSEEVKQFERAFNDETFRKLVVEYANELSDPKHREEQQVFIKQLEKNHDLPPGKVLIHPKAGFVVKCMLKRKRSKNEGVGKLFLNIVHSMEVLGATSNTASASTVDNSSSECGMNFSVPYALGPIRMERDKSGHLVPTCDCCFNPLTLQYAIKSKSFCDMIVEIAKDAIKLSYEKNGDDITWVSGFIILRGVAYKFGSPLALMVDCKHKINYKSPISSDKKMITDEATDGIIEQAKEDLSNVIASIDDPDVGTQIVVPKHKIVEQGIFDMADHTRIQSVAMSRRPKRLLVHIDLDIESANEISLDVSGKNLVLMPAKDSKCQYYLELLLPYPVTPQNGNARFDKEKRTLVVTLPVVDE